MIVDDDLEEVIDLRKAPGDPLGRDVVRRLDCEAYRLALGAVLIIWARIEAIAGVVIFVCVVLDFQI